MSTIAGSQSEVSGKPHGPWTVCLPSAQIASVGSLRLLPGVEVHASGEWVWLRGRQLEEGLDRRLRSVPGAKRFRILADGQLLAAGHRVPQGQLPDGPWVPLARWMGIEAPEACRAAQLPQPITLELRRSSRVVEPSVLLTSMESWLSCADDCPQVRLDRWRFAVCSEGRVAIEGRPLPSLPGRRLVNYEGIAVPAGWYWSPAVEPAIVRERFGLEGDDLALWLTAGSWERIVASDFVRATRAAIRASAEGFQHGRP